MRLTTLCYIEKDNCYLILHRTKKVNDQNYDKWLGIGGKFEADESPDECLLREVKEETGLTLKSYDFRGIITFVSDQWETEYMHLFTADEYEGDITTHCLEGNLEWILKDDLFEKKIWEGDRIFLKRLDGSKDFFSLKLRYEGERLAEYFMKETIGMAQKEEGTTNEFGFAE